MSKAHKKALARIDELMGAKRDSSEANELEILAGIVAEYEAMRFPASGAVFKSLWKFGERVHMDGDTSIIGVVTGMTWYSADYCDVQVGWFHNGTDHSTWIEDWRLSRVEAA